MNFFCYTELSRGSQLFRTVDPKEWIAHEKQTRDLKLPSMSRLSEKHTSVRILEK